MFAGPKNLPRWTFSTCAVITLGCLPLTLAHGQQPDNSAVNKGQRTTAQSQSAHHSDREITARIRRDLMKDKHLSTYGHNVKIITRDGAVTLKGPVHTEQEKQAIVTRATGIAGEGKVTDQLTIKQ